MKQTPPNSCGRLLSEAAAVVAVVAAFAAASVEVVSVRASSVALCWKCKYLKGGETTQKRFRVKPVEIGR